MIWILLVTVGWPIVAGVVGLLLGATVRSADRRAAGACPIAALEVELSAGASAAGPGRPRTAAAG